MQIHLDQIQCILNVTTPFQRLRASGGMDSSWFQSVPLVRNLKGVRCGTVTRWYAKRKNRTGVYMLTNCGIVLLRVIYQRVYLLVLIVASGVGAVRDRQDWQYGIILAQK